MNMEQCKINVSTADGELAESFYALPCFSKGDCIEIRNSKKRTLISAFIISIRHDIVKHEQSVVHEVNITVNKIIKKEYPFPV